MLQTKLLNLLLMNTCVTFVLCFLLICREFISLFFFSYKIPVDKCLAPAAHLWMRLSPLQASTIEGAVLHPSIHLLTSVLQGHSGDGAFPGVKAEQVTSSPEGHRETNNLQH